MLKPMPLPELSDNPLVTVIIANYNYGRFLPDAVKSVVDQTYSNWELIICDDGSTDDSASIAKALERSDPRITVLQKDNGGQVSAWNHAYQHCSGNIICFLDSDDVFLPDKLEFVVKALSTSPLAGLAYHRYRIADKELRPLPHSRPGELKSGWLVQQALLNGGQAFTSKTSDISVRREIMERVMPLPEKLGFADGYICRVSVFLTEIIAIPDALSYYRVHGENDTGNLESLNRRALVKLVSLLHQNFQYQLEFLSNVVGQDLQEKLQIENHRELWRLMAALYILQGKPSDGIEGYSAVRILEVLSCTRQKYLWKLLFTLPMFVSEPLLRFWWSDAAWKRLLQPITGLLGMRERSMAG
jgi:glycosyltransferase involved in cell wall biosynthesis